VEVEALCYHGELGHVLLVASRMRTDEVGYDLLAKSRLLVYLVEKPLELIEEGERWLAHELQHTV